MLFRINANGHDKLQDDSLIAVFMKKLMEKHPQLTGYQYERDEHGYINILVWGENGK